MTRLDARGFSLIELLVATAIFMAVAAILFHFIGSAQRLGRAQPDAADVTQRLRAAATAISRDIERAGAGDAGGALGSLSAYLAPVMPARTGAASPDPELTAFDDRISLVFAEEQAVAVRLGADMVAAAADVPVLAADPGCPSAGLCGFEAGTRAAIVDTSGSLSGYDIFTATHVAGALGHGSPDQPFWKPYLAATSRVVPIVQRTYYHDKPGNRLMVYDGYKSTHPLIDNVVELRFAYLIDPSQSSVPPPASTAGNCVYAPGDPPVPLLASAGTGTLVPAPLTMFTDGPYCGVSPRRFDGDLLRIRAVRLTLRVQAALDRSRGSGPQFANAGTSSSDLSSVRDLEVTIRAAPRNMRAAR